MEEKEPQALEEPEEPEEIDEIEAQHEQQMQEYQEQLQKIREQNEQQGQYITVPETDLEFEAKLVEPGINVQDIFDSKKYGQIKRKLLNFINLNLTTSNYDDKTMREMRIGAMAAIKILDAML